MDFSRVIEAINSYDPTCWKNIAIKYDSSHYVWVEYLPTYNLLANTTSTLRVFDLDGNVVVEGTLNRNSSYASTNVRLYVIDNYIVTSYLTAANCIGYRVYHLENGAFTLVKTITPNTTYLKYVDLSTIFVYKDCDGNYMLTLTTNVTVQDPTFVNLLTGAMTHDEGSKNQRVSTTAFYYNSDTNKLKIVKHNLTTSTTQFFGTYAEITAVAQALDTSGVRLPGLMCNFMMFPVFNYTNSEEDIKHELFGRQYNTSGYFNNIYFNSDYTSAYVGDMTLEYVGITATSGYCFNFYGMINDDGLAYYSMNLANKQIECFWRAEDYEVDPRKISNQLEAKNKLRQYAIDVNEDICIRHDIVENLGGFPVSYKTGLANQLCRYSNIAFHNRSKDFIENCTITSITGAPDSDGYHVTVNILGNAATQTFYELKIYSYETDQIIPSALTISDDGPTASATFICDETFYIVAKYYELVISMCPLTSYATNTSNHTVTSVNDPVTIISGDTYSSRLKIVYTRYISEYDLGDFDFYDINNYDAKCEGYITSEGLTNINNILAITPILYKPNQAEYFDPDDALIICDNNDYIHIPYHFISDDHIICAYFTINGLDITLSISNLLEGTTIYPNVTKVYHDNLHLSQTNICLTQLQYDGTGIVGTFVVTVDTYDCNSYTCGGIIIGEECPSNSAYIDPIEYFRHDSLTIRDNNTLIKRGVLYKFDNILNSMLPVEEVFNHTAIDYMNFYLTRYKQNTETAITGERSKEFFNNYDIVNNVGTYFNIILNESDYLTNHYLHNAIFSYGLASNRAGEPDYGTTELYLYYNGRCPNSIFSDIDPSNNIILITIRFSNNIDYTAAMNNIYVLVFVPIAGDYDSATYASIAGDYRYYTHLFEQAYSLTDIISYLFISYYLACVKDDALNICYLYINLAVFDGNSNVRIEITDAANADGNHPQIIYPIVITKA